MFVDTHTHLYLDEFAPTPQDAVQRAIDAGVTKMIFPNVDLSTINPMKELSSSFTLNTYMAMGLHPTEIKETWVEDLAKTKEEFDKHIDKYIAIGEIGIDLYWDKTFRSEQMQALEQQFQWAIDANIPVIIHCREGLNEILEVLDSMTEKPIGVFHSFGGTVNDVEQIRKRGDFYFGINGIVTFKNSKLREILPHIGIDRILLETDAPYLAPVPHRGKRNESAYLIHTAAYIAQHLSLTTEQVAQKTSYNAHQLFGI
ncbi:MAG: TatD family hydrolase [Muribaculaceae bacterium]|nr:TatD family hydrolase [Muribaculaceae bacterium]